MPKIPQNIQTIPLEHFDRPLLAGHGPRMASNVPLEGMSHAAMMESLKNELIIVLMKRLRDRYNDDLIFPVKEVDDTYNDMLAFAVKADPAHGHVFKFDLRKKSR